MIRQRRLFLFSIYFLFASSAPQLMAQHNLEPLKKALAKQATHQSVQVKLRQKKQLPALKEPIQNTGYLWLIPGKAFRWQLGEPKASTAIYDSNHVYLLDEQKKTGTQLSTNHRKVKPLLIMLGIGEGASYNSMMETFNVSGVTHEKAHYVIVLIPKSGKLKRAVKHLIIQINTKTSFFERIEWLQKDGAKITTEFYPPILNKALPPAIFSIRKENYKWQ